MRDARIPAPKQAAPTRPKDEIARLGDEIYERDNNTRYVKSR